ncbi:hypothetical protein [Ancylothrix sp. D3o]|nr:hypothetical protein [Ancylothrix sp. D3o]
MSLIALIESTYALIVALKILNAGCEKKTLKAIAGNQVRGEGHF